MTLVALVSAKGAPGVTTTAVALAALAGSSAVAADLDPAGGDLALRYRTPDGLPLDPGTGLLSLAARLRGDGAEPGDDPLAPHLQAVAGGLSVLAGVRRPEQTSGLASLWPQLTRALARSPRTPVIADCGRVWSGSPVLPVLRAADAVVVLARAELEELAHLRERLPMIAAELPPAPATGGRLGVVLLSPDRDRTAAAARTQQLLRSAGLKVPVVGAIADDRRGADVLRGLRRGRAARTPLVRSARAVLPSVLALGERIAVADEAPAAVLAPEAKRFAELQAWVRS